jgi:hypothetical protein
MMTALSDPVNGRATAERVCLAAATIAPDHRIENQRTIAPVEKSAIWSA